MRPIAGMGIGQSACDETQQQQISNLLKKNSSNIFSHFPTIQVFVMQDLQLDCKRTYSQK